MMFLKILKVLKNLRFWFNPPFNEDGEFYNILDCVGDTLDNAVYAIETHEES